MQPGNTAFSYILMSFSDAVSSHSLAHTVSCQITTKEMRNSHPQTTSYTISNVRCLHFKWILSKVRRWKIAFEDDLTIIPSYRAFAMWRKKLQTLAHIYPIVFLSLGITYSTAQISRVWTPPIPSAHSSHSHHWNQTWVTAEKRHRTICCASVVCHRSILRGNRRTTVNWETVKFS